MSAPEPAPSESVDWQIASDVADPEPLAPGRRLGGYRLDRVLGRGAMGQVYAAHGPRGPVALKISAPGVDARARERFVREGQLLAGLRHPGLVRVEAAGAHGDRVFLACELITGARTLDEAWFGLSLRERAALIRDVAAAVGHAHAQGVVHRDLKPGNVLVGEDGRPTVIDFGVGLSRSLERLTATGTSVGTPYWMAPEQATGDRQAIGPASDVWSLGVLLYQALTEQLPFRGATLLEQRSIIVRGDPIPPSRLAPEVPHQLEAICLRALRREPDERYASGQDLAAALDRWLAGAPEGRGVGRAAWAGVVVAVVGGGLLAWTQARPGAAASSPTAAASSPTAATSSPTAAASSPTAAASRPGAAAAGAALGSPRLEATTAPPPLIDCEALVRRGADLFDRGRVEEALATAERCSAIDPDFASARLLRALCLGRLGRPREALAEASAYRHLQPGDGEGVMVWSLLRAELGEPEPAADALAGWLQIAPPDAPYVETLETDLLPFVRAFMRFGANRAARVLLDWGVARESTPLRLSARAAVLIRLGRRDEALADLDQALAEDPQLGEALYRRAQLHYEQGREDQAQGDVAALLAAQDLDPEVHAWGLLLRGRMRAAREDRAGARADLEAALEVAPPGWSQAEVARQGLERLRPR